MGFQPSTVWKKKALQGPRLAIATSWWYRLAIVKGDTSSKAFWTWRSQTCLTRGHGGPQNDDALEKVTFFKHGHFLVSILDFWGVLVGGFNQPLGKICSSNWIISPNRGEHKNIPKNPDPSKMAVLRTRTPAIQVQTLPLEGPRILRDLKPPTS